MYTFTQNLVRNAMVIIHIVITCNENDESTEMRSFTQPTNNPRLIAKALSPHSGVNLVRSLGGRESGRIQRKKCPIFQAKILTTCF